MSPGLFFCQAYLSDRHHTDGPELAQLKDLKFGDGLPPGLQEVHAGAGGGGGGDRKSVV